MSRFLPFLLLAANQVAWPQQRLTIDPASVTNAASYLVKGQPGYGLAQGGMFVVKGSSMGACGTRVVNSFPLPTNLGGTSMKITVGSTSVDVVMVYVVSCRPNTSDGNADQLAGIVPSNTPTGNGTLTISYNGQSANTPVTIVANQFGIFTINQQGVGPGVFTDPNFAVNTLTTAAKPGDLLFVWGTGLGAISSSDAAAPPVGDINVPVDVFVGDKKADVSYKGRSGCCSGIDQILFTVPQGVTGCYVPVVVRAGTSVSNFTTISISANGRSCSDPQGYTASDLVNAGNNAKLGFVTLTTASGKFAFPSGSAQGTIELGEAHFRNFFGNGLLGSTAGAIAGVSYGVPSQGCLVYPFQKDSNKFFDLALDLGGENGFNTTVDAGSSLNFKAPGGNFALASDGSPNPEYGTGGPIGGSLPPSFPGGPLQLTPGAVSLDNGAGGKGVGSFTTSINLPSNPITWTNQDGINNIPRSQDLTVTWSGGGPSVVIIGVSGDPSAKALAKFVCNASGSAGSFTIPKQVLLALPPSAVVSDVNAPLGSLLVMTPLATPARFSARGLDAGFFNWVYGMAKNVVYQ